MNVCKLPLICFMLVLCGSLLIKNLDILVCLIKHDSYERIIKTNLGFCGIFIKHKNTRRVGRGGVSLSFDTHFWKYVKKFPFLNHHKSLDVTLILMGLFKHNVDIPRLAFLKVPLFKKLLLIVPFVNKWSSFALFKTILVFCFLEASCSIFLNFINVPFLTIVQVAFIYHNVPVPNKCCRCPFCKTS